MQIKIFILLQCLLISALVVASLLGDFLVNHFEKHLHKALTDNGTHAAIAGLSWVIVSLHIKSTNMPLEALSCTMLASLIDLDHFFKARSFRLKAATSIKTRPPLHCSTVPFLLCVILLAIGQVFDNKWLQKWAFLIFTAFISHHIRDATRRGFWFYPFGSTSPISHVFYVASTCLLPYFVSFVMIQMKLQEKSYYSKHEVV